MTPSLNLSISFCMFTSVVRNGVSSNQRFDLILSRVALYSVKKQYGRLGALVFIHKLNIGDRKVQDARAQAQSDKGLPLS